MLSMLEESSTQESTWTAAALRVHQVQVVAIKATEGTDYVNPYYSWQLDQARRAGCVVVHLHLAHPQSNRPTAEFEWFLKHSSVRPGELVMLDVEPLCFAPLDAARASEWVGSFSSSVQSAFAVLPVIYAHDDQIANGSLESVRGESLLSYVSPGASAVTPPIPPRPWAVSFLNNNIALFATPELLRQTGRPLMTRTVAFSVEARTACWVAEPVVAYFEVVG